MKFSTPLGSIDGAKAGTNLALTAAQLVLLFKGVVVVEAEASSIHIDIGGYGKYEGAINFTASDPEFAKTIPNLVEGYAQFTLQKVESNIVKLVTIENCDIGKPVSLEAVRVLKVGGELRIKTPLPEFDAAKYAKDYNLEVKSTGEVTEYDSEMQQNITYKTATFIKKKN